MASHYAFQPTGPTILVAATAVNILQYSTTNSYRIRNLAASAQYFTYGQLSSVTSLQPAAGVPANNTLSMNANEVKTFTLSGAVFMIASSATGFEVTPGDGI